MLKFRSATIKSNNDTYGSQDSWKTNNGISMEKSNFVRALCGVTHTVCAAREWNFNEFLLSHPSSSPTFIRFAAKCDSLCSSHFSPIFLSSLLFIVVFLLFELQGSLVHFIYTSAWSINNGVNNINFVGSCSRHETTVAHVKLCLNFPSLFMLVCCSLINKRCSVQL